MPVVYNRIPQIMITAPLKVQTALAKTAFDTQINAIQRAPVDTGNLVNSIRTQQEGPFKWTVTAHAEYAIYVEVGTRNTPGREYMVGALRQTWPKMMNALRNVGLGSV
jgi:HK97 gp10 family phage protein